MMYVLTTSLADLVLPEQYTRRESIVTVGAFDGIHLGHQALIGGLVARAREEGRVAGLVTFYPHPLAVLRPDRPAQYLTTPGEKAALLEPLGLDWMVVVLFTPQLAQMPARAFVQALVQRLRMHVLWVGPDFALGRDRAGDLPTLRELGREMGFEVYEVPYYGRDSTKVSSTHIRTLVRRGHVEEAARLLGRRYSVSGEVVHGAHRGRCLGYPTANLDVHPDRVVPANGIYATFACLGSERRDSVTSIGIRPTFDGGERRIETYLLDYRGDLYGHDLVVEFVARLRPEKRFADVEALVAQIDRDVAQTREILGACCDAVAECPSTS
jgi:riboflavin kinase/FMN adenylyltransferase